MGIWPLDRFWEAPESSQAMAVAYFRAKSQMEYQAQKISERKSRMRSRSSKPGAPAGLPRARRRPGRR